MPEGLADLCCGQPFESKGFAAAADRKSAELEAALRAASDGGRVPIVFDTSPCAYRMKRYAGARLQVLDSIEFIHDVVLPRVTHRRRCKDRWPYTRCAACARWARWRSSRPSRARCSDEVATVPDVLCCGFAGDKGFDRPELNEHALRHLARSLPAGCTHGYSTSRTCEIGLSEQAGFAYRSVIDLVEACAREMPS